MTLIGPTTVHIFDTTLRDGEQSPGISLNTQEKVEIAQQLARLGVDVIEAGFPITSPGDFEAVEAIARTVEGPVICGLARTHKADIDAAWGAVKDAERPRIHTFISTSDIHIKHQLQTDREDVKGQARAAVAHGASPTARTSSSRRWTRPAPTSSSPPRSARSRSPRAPTVINIPDTVGYTTPAEYAALLRRLYELVPELRDVRALGPLPRRPGARGRQLLRRRAGRRAAGRVRDQRDRRAGRQLLARGDRDAAADPPRRARARHRLRDARDRPHQPMVTRFTGYAVQPNKAIVGRNAFAHESGIHQDGVLKERTTYEIMDARDVGLDSNSIVLGKHSGRHALRDALEQLGFKVEGNALNQAFKRFKEIADKKKQVTALDLEAIVSDEMREASAALRARLVRGRGLAAEREPLARVARDDARRRGGGRRVGRRRAGRRDLRRDPRRDPGRLRAPPVHRLRGHRGRGRARRGDGDAPRPRAPASGQGVATDILEASARAYVRALSNALEGAAVREAEGVDGRCGDRAGHAGAVSRPAMRTRSAPMAGSLEGRKALITGASSGIGEAAALAMVAEGAAVALGARRKDRLDELAGRIEAERRQGRRDRVRHLRGGAGQGPRRDRARRARRPRLPGQQRRRDAARPARRAPTPSEWRHDDRGQLPRAPLLHPHALPLHARRRGRGRRQRLLGGRPRSPHSAAASTT